MSTTDNDLKKPRRRAVIAPKDKLLVRREEAAEILSISVRSLDYLLANRQLLFRRIGGRTLIPITELQRYARMDHPGRIANQRSGRILFDPQTERASHPRSMDRLESGN
jgi:excisionase family DNA binding protein